MTSEPSTFQSRLKPQSSYSFQAGSNVPTQNRSSTPAPWANLHAEGYTAIDPYTASISHSIHNLQSRENSESSLEDIDIPEHFSGYQPSALTASVAGLDEIKQYTLTTYLIAFIVDTLPRLLYSCVLLRLPSLYFSRVARVFEDADLTMPEIKRMALDLANIHRENVHQVLFTNLSSSAPSTSHFWALKTNWESFIESLLREWKTLNIISVLLLSAILTVLQIDSAAADPLTRYSALLSLISALMSLLYGCIFIIRFGGMKKPHKAAEWAWEARRTRTMIWWNVWVMLAMPAIWLSWSVVAYIICIMAFVWRTGSTLDGIASPLAPHYAFWPRLIISLFLALGVIYFILITTTLSQYGSRMDRKWRDRVRGWTDRLVYEQPFPGYMASSHLRVNQWQASVHGQPVRKYSDDSDAKPFIPSARSYSRSPSPIHVHEPSLRIHQITGQAYSADNERPSVLPHVQTFRAVELRFQSANATELPQALGQRQFSQDLWTQFLDQIFDAWNVSPLDTPQASVLRVVSTWNNNLLQRISIEAILCQEYYPEWPESPVYVVYLVDRQPVHGRVLSLEQRFGPVPAGLIRLDILDFSDHTHRWATLFPERGTEVHFKISSPSGQGSPVQYRPHSGSLRSGRDGGASDVSKSSTGDNDGIYIDEPMEGEQPGGDIENTILFPGTVSGCVSTSSLRPATPQPSTHDKHRQD